MNCRPGDLAVIVKPGSPNYGRFVTVRELYDGRRPFIGTFYRGWHGEPAWIVEGTDLVLVSPKGRTFAPWHVVHDEWLRPIRDPGEDAKDEMLRPLPAPSEPIPA